MPHSYSPSTKGWYTDALVYPNLPDDLIPVDDDEYAKWSNDSSLLIDVQGGQVVMVTPPPPPPPQPSVAPTPLDAPAAEASEQAPAKKAKKT